MKREQKREFAEFVRQQLAEPPEVVDAIDVLRRIAMHSDDIRARLSCIRMLATELAGRERNRPGSAGATWAVKKIAPSSPGWTDRVPKDSKDDDD